jgi:hypothetical protein
MRSKISGRANLGWKLIAFFVLMYGPVPRAWHAARVPRDSVPKFVLSPQLSTFPQPTRTDVGLVLECLSQVLASERDTVSVRTLDEG